MVIYLICFDLSASPQEQRDQIFFWLQFLHSSIPRFLRMTTYSEINSNNSNDDKNWRVLVVGLKSDLKTAATFTSSSLQAWQSQMPDLPLFQSHLFEVSSTHAKQSVRDLLDCVSLVSSQIFEKHAVLIPSSYRKLFNSIKSSTNSDTPPLHSPPLTDSTNPILIHFTQLHDQLKVECNMDLPSFERALRYFHSIGQIVFLQNGMVCKVPTFIPKLLAKFVSPLEVQNHLLLENSEVQILNQQQIGFILQVNNTNNTKYVTNTTY